LFLEIATIVFTGIGIGHKKRKVPVPANVNVAEPKPPRKRKPAARKSEVIDCAKAYKGEDRPGSELLGNPEHIRPPECDCVPVPEGSSELKAEVEVKTRPDESRGGFFFVLIGLRHPPTPPAFQVAAFSLRQPARLQDLLPQLRIADRLFCFDELPIPAFRYKLAHRPYGS
jgi:hypothetical protein